MKPASPDVVKKNVHLISEYGRWDDVFTLIGTDLEGMVIDLIVTALDNEDGSKEEVVFHRNLGIVQKLDRRQCK